ncbi:hypothetical protein JXQ31_03680 [candidate division KSB1 bacterium]|nr:hypothetical protein [candidate division KSB1 bacterium]
MRKNNKQIFVLLLCVLTSAVYGQNPISLPLQSKAGEKITGVIADPVLDVYINPAMMKFDKFTIFTGGTIDDLNAPSKLDLPLNNSFLYIFVPFRTWSFGVMADGQLKDNIMGFNQDLIHAPLYDHEYYNLNFLLNKQLFSKINLGISCLYRNAPNSDIDNYIHTDYLLNSVYAPDKFAGGYKSFDVKAGLQIKLLPSLSVLPSITWSQISKKQYNKEYKAIYPNFKATFNGITDTTTYIDNYNFLPFDFKYPSYDILIKWNLKNILFRFQGNYHTYEFTEKYVNESNEYHQIYDPSTTEHYTYTEYEKNVYQKDKKLSKYALKFGADIPLGDYFNVYLAYHHQIGKTTRPDTDPKYYRHEYGDKLQMFTSALQYKLSTKMFLYYSISYNSIQNLAQNSHSRSVVIYDRYHYKFSDYYLGFEYQFIKHLKGFLLINNVPYIPELISFQLQYEL